MPLPLGQLVLERYGPSAPVPDHQALSVEDLIDYLRRNDQHRRAPLQTVLDQLEAMGDPAEPLGEHRAYLEWLGTGLDDWEERYPLSGPLVKVLLPLRTLMSVLVVEDASFLRAGAHPLHRFLDQVVRCAVGWHDELGRAGQTLLAQVEHASSALLARLTDPDTDLEAICDEFCERSERDRKRALRMAQRTADTEAGKARSELARHDAAHMINSHLARYPAPPSIGAFLKKDWFKSAQLVLLKFGEHSVHWQSMNRTTGALLESLQSVEELTEERRRHIFEMASRLPREVRRWLLSLHHDLGAVDDAVDLIKFAHMRVLRQQALELVKISPISQAKKRATPAADKEKLETLKAVREGQWFLIDSGTEPAQRVRLSLNMQQQNRLMFTNHAGLKALHLDYDRFLELLTQRKIKRLHQDVSFSSCLAKAAGIQTVEDLKSLLQNRAGPGTAAEGPAMGDWMGFHDGEKPLLARVAVHDKQRDTYIFVNREGIKLRECTGPDLKAMMEQGLVEVLEAKNSFPSEVSKARSAPNKEETEE